MKSGDKQNYKDHVCLKITAPASDDLMTLASDLCLVSSCLVSTVTIK